MISVTSCHWVDVSCTLGPLVLIDSAASQIPPEIGPARWGAHPTVPLLLTPESRAPQHSCQGPWVVRLILAGAMSMFGPEF